MFRANSRSLGPSHPFRLWFHPFGRRTSPMAPLPEAYYGKRRCSRPKARQGLYVVPCRKAANVVRRGATCDARTPERRNKDGLPAQNSRRRTCSACGFVLPDGGCHKWRPCVRRVTGSSVTAGRKPDRPACRTMQKSSNVVRRGATCDARTPERRNKDGLPAQDPRRRTRSACGFVLPDGGRHKWRPYLRRITGSGVTAGRKPDRPVCRTMQKSCKRGT